MMFLLVLYVIDNHILFSNTIRKSAISFLPTIEIREM